MGNKIARTQNRAVQYIMFQTEWLLIYILLNVFRPFFIPKGYWILANPGPKAYNIASERLPLVDSLAPEPNAKKHITT